MRAMFSAARRMLLRCCALLCVLSSGAGAVASCEPVRIPMCQSMLWNMTRMPNHLHHSTQENAILSIEQFQDLLDTQCSAALRFFLCAMYAPICTIEFQTEPIKPCKAVCEAARDACRPVMRQYNHDWPESMACEELPVYERAVCISPEAIVTVMPEDEKSTDSTSVVFMQTEGPHPPPACRNNSPERCKCRKIKANQKTYTAKNYNYVIRARVKDVHRSGCSEIQTTVEVKDVIKSSGVSISRGEVHLYTNSSCLCPELLTADEYIIMGYEDRMRTRLLLFDGCVAEKWKERWGKKVKVLIHKGYERRHRFPIACNKSAGYGSTTYSAVPASFELLGQYKSAGTRSWADQKALGGAPQQSEGPGSVADPRVAPATMAKTAAAKRGVDGREVDEIPETDVS